VFPKLLKLLNQEHAWAYPVYLVISALRRCALAGPEECHGKACSSHKRGNDLFGNHGGALFLTQEWRERLQRETSRRGEVPKMRVYSRLNWETLA
jgi:hypothetical protein